jgi:SAM-dependent methyltransferase
MFLRGREVNMNTITRDWNWWAYLFRVKHRQTIPHIEQYDDELAAFIVETLDLRPGDRLLDLGCGSGVHALRLAQRGIQVVGLDIAPSLVGMRRAGEKPGDQGDVRRGRYAASGRRWSRLGAPVSGSHHPQHQFWPGRSGRLSGAGERGSRSSGGWFVRPADPRH